MPLVEYSPLDEMERSDRARRTPLIQDNNPVEDKRSRDVTPFGSNEEEMFLPVRTLRQQYIDYLDIKVDEIEEQKENRRYYHGAQLTDEQRRVLRLRHQPIQIWNRIGRKVNGIVGLVERMRSDPKAEGRDPKSEAGAEIANQSIRYVLDANQFKTVIEPCCLLQDGIEGIAGTQLVLIKGDKGDPDLGIYNVIGDEFFYDPKSYRFDFSDARYKGIAKWVALDAAIEMFPEQAELLESLFQGDSDLTTNSDREIKWLMTSSRNLRLVEHWYKYRGRWCWAFYCSTVLIDQGVSPFFDERGNSEHSFNVSRAFIDQDGDTYSFVRTLRGPQDALNQGKSKTLALANNRLLIMEKGAVDDVEIARREAARHDGVIETNPQKQLKIEKHSEDIAAFAAMTESAMQEMDGFANANIPTLNGTGNISGKAIELLRQPGMAELGPFILAQRARKLGLYRKIWNACQRHWKAERWIRVSNNDKIAQFIQLNGLELDQSGRPQIVNAVGALDVNIVLDEGPDLTSLMEELSNKLGMYPPGTFPPQVLIEMDPHLPRSEKDRLLKLMQPQPNPMQQAAAKADIEGKFAKNAKTAAETQRTLAQARQADATAAKNRAGATTEAARAGHLAHASHLDAAEFVRDSILEAHKVMQPFLQQPQPSQAPRF